VRRRQIQDHADLGEIIARKSSRLAAQLDVHAIRHAGSEIQIVGHVLELHRDP